MKAKLWGAILLAVILSFTLFTVVGHADFGDYGGDSDYGGWDSGDDWDWGDDDDDDYGGWYGGSDSGSSGSSSSGGSSFAVAIIVELVCGLIFFGIPLLISMGIGYFISKFKRKNNKTVMPGATPTPVASLLPMAQFLSYDPGFSADALCEQLANRYVQFQNAWQNKDLRPLRPYLTDAFYAQMDRQLEQYRRNHQTNRVERIAVLGVDLVGWKQNGSVNEIVARLRTRIVDYVVDDQTGALVRGSATAEKFMEYEWTLVRAVGIVTGNNDCMTVHNCPNCGAVLNINQTAQCAYCGSIVTVEAHEWAVSKIKGLSQRTSGK